MKLGFILFILLFSINSYADKYKITFESITTTSDAQDSGLGLLSKDVETKMAIGCPVNAYKDNDKYREDRTLLHPHSYKYSNAHSVIPGHSKVIKESFDFDYEEMRTKCENAGRTLYIMLLEDGSLADSVIQYVPVQDIVSKLEEQPHYFFTLSNLGFFALVSAEKI